MNSGVPATPFAFRPFTSPANPVDFGFGFGYGYGFTSPFLPTPAELATIQELLRCRIPLPPHSPAMPLLHSALAAAPATLARYDAALAQLRRECERLEEERWRLAMYAECCRGVLGLVWRGVEARVGVGVGACGVYEDAHAENGGPSPAFEYAPPPTTTPTKREHLTPPLLSADRNGNGIAYSVYEATHAESGEPSPAFDYTPPLTTTPTKREESTPPLLSPPSADVKGDGFACGVYEDTHAESGEASSAFESTTPTTITIKREESTPPLPSPPSADIEQNEIPTKEEEEEVAEHTEDARDDTHTHHSASSPVRASPAPSRDFESESQHPNYHYYEQLEQRHLSRNEKARVRMARKRAQRKLLPLEAQAAIVEREREYQKKYRTKNRAVLRQLEKQRRLDLYRAKYGDEAFEVYVRERAERGARRLEQKKSLENRQARDEGDEEDEVEEDELDTSDDDGGGGNPSLTLRGAGPHWHVSI